MSVYTVMSLLGEVSLSIFGVCSAETSNTGDTVGLFTIESYYYFDMSVWSPITEHL